ncbi:hypothetical protein PHYPSEUDO_009791 [Phytophthora pseudosyringae]|uniref:Uncharacterized protein n=1 Tax=Phytophthora pseudosyringae TaxID=221518 RepID=A0A8T1VC61_9STRA|nr:hypothetical protein PHYPSEUDO_009791 [Phytophthora pseudosyringae]
MGCCPSKSPAAKEHTTTTEVASIVPSSVSANQVEAVLANAVGDMLMDRGDGTPMDKSDDEEPGPEDDESASFKLPPREPEGVVKALWDEVFARSPVAAVQSPPSPPPSPPRKSSRCADDIPILTTYHRVHSAEVAVQEAKRHEELRLEAEQREREVREYKAAMQSSR